LNQVSVPQSVASSEPYLHLGISWDTAFLSYFMDLFSIITHCFITTYHMHPWNVTHLLHQG